MKPEYPKLNGLLHQFNVWIEVRGPREPAEERARFLVACQELDRHIVRGMYWEGSMAAGVVWLLLFVPDDAQATTLSQIADRVQAELDEKMRSIVPPWLRKINLPVVEGIGRTKGRVSAYVDFHFIATIDEYIETDGARFEWQKGDRVEVKLDKADGQPRLQARIAGFDMSAYTWVGDVVAQVLPIFQRAAGFVATKETVTR